jgi:hypothetical protein
MSVSFHFSISLALRRQLQNLPEVLGMKCLLQTSTSRFALDMGARIAWG